MRLPKKAKHGLTWRQLRKVLRTPSILFRNARFYWRDETSSEEHIFVLGPPKSGTTLVKNVLQSNTEVCGVEGETWFFLRRNFAGFHHPSVSDERMEQIIQASRSVTDLFDRFAATVRQNKGGERFLEKTPEHALRLSYLLSHFPAAHVVFVVRDPRDGLRSAKDHSSYWWSLPDEDRTGGYLATWKECVASYRRHAGHDALELIRYEDFCRHPDEVLSRVADAIGLTVQEHQLTPTHYGTSSLSESDSHARLQEPITPQSVGKWKDELDKQEVTRVERALADEMAALDYSLTRATR